MIEMNQSGSAMKTLLVVTAAFGALAHEQHWSREPSALECPKRMQCASDQQWYCCADKRCIYRRSCASNPALATCACTPPTAATAVHRQGAQKPHGFPKRNPDCANQKLRRRRSAHATTPPSDNSGSGGRERRLATSGQRVRRIPAILWQTGRTLTAEYEELRQRMASQGMLLANTKYMFRTDAEMRDDVANMCPFALTAFDCVLAPAFKADLWRYCVLWKHGGVYLDMEDALVVPLATLMDPCDTLVLTNDLCWQPGHKFTSVDDFFSPVALRKHCEWPAVQISFMAGEPGHPFFLCCLQKAMSMIRSRAYGKSTLAVTGPLNAGQCLSMLNGKYRMEMQQVSAHHIDLYRGLAPPPGALLHFPHWPAIRTHNISSAKAKTKSYRDLWKERELYSSNRSCTASVGNVSTRR